MGVQKSQKGRQSAASQLQEISRRTTRGPRNDHPGRQQFGGVGTAPGTDRTVDHLSRRASQAIQDLGTRRGRRGGTKSA
jgi:hypothetical protein